MKKITIIGGDIRLRTAREVLLREGYTVDTLGLYENDRGTPESSDVLLLPVPVTRDGESILCPMTKRGIPLSIIEGLDAEKLILCGNYSFKDRKYIDYCALDSYALLNAVPTAEGAIAMAIEKTAFTLWHSRVLVIGYGRVGRVLCDRLRGMRCDVTVSARKSADFALLDALGFTHIHTSRIAERTREYDIIFNTADAPVLDSALDLLSGVLVIDLSTSGCLDYVRAEKSGVRAYKAPGLPGITAPETAGKILAQTVVEIISQYA